MTVFRDLTEVTVFLSLSFSFIPWLASALLTGRFWGVNSCQEIQRSPFSSASLGKITLLTLGKNKSYEGLFSATRNGVHLLYTKPMAHGIHLRQLRGLTHTVKADPGKAWDGYQKTDEKTSW